MTEHVQLYNTWQEWEEYGFFFPRLIPLLDKKEKTLFQDSQPQSDATKQTNEMRLFLV